MDFANRIVTWIMDHFKLAYIATPFGTRNMIYRVKHGSIGFTDVFIFGVRIMRIQRTNPWGQ